MLAPLETGRSAIVLGVNDAGVAVGISHSTAVMWDVQGNITSLGTLPGDLYSEANDINDSGVIVGVSADDLGQRAVKYTPGIGMEALPNPGVESWANAINNAGQIVGGVRHANGQYNPVLWDSDSGPPTLLSEFLAKTQRRQDIVDVRLGPAPTDRTPRTRRMWRSGTGLARTGRDHCTAVDGGHGVFTGRCWESKKWP
jgi:uncharacterized membrane protein